MQVNEVARRPSGADTAAADTIPTVPDNTRDAARVACENLIASMRSVVDRFAQESERLNMLLLVLEGDALLSESLSRVDFQIERSGLTGVLDDFEAARREARLSAWRLMASEGCSIGEMGRIFGLSRQLISRQLRLGDAETDNAAP